MDNFISSDKSFPLGVSLKNIFMWIVFVFFKQVIDFLGEVVQTREREYSVIIIRDAYF